MGDSYSLGKAYYFGQRRQHYKTRNNGFTSKREHKGYFTVYIAKLGN
jgi:hypothetical protein